MATNAIRAEHETTTYYYYGTIGLINDVMPDSNFKLGDKVYVVNQGAWLIYNGTGLVEFKQPKISTYVDPSD